MTPTNVQQTLKDARHVIHKMAGWLGIDIDELDEDYNGICERLDNAIQSLEGEE